jgi:hypothetical protein
VKSTFEKRIEQRTTSTPGASGKTSAGSASVKKERN